MVSNLSKGVEKQIKCSDKRGCLELDGSPCQPDTPDAKNAKDKQYNEAATAPRKQQCQNEKAERSRLACLKDGFVFKLPLE